MSSRLRQQGSAHVVVTAVLIVALISVLGFVFWQNFMKQGSDDAATKNTMTGQSDMSSMAMSTVRTKKYATNLSLQYPTDWTMMTTHSDKQATDGDVTADGAVADGETIIITSPDKAVSVKLFQSNAGGWGGTCNPNDPETGVLSHVVKKDIPGETSVSYFESISGKDGAYYPRTSVLENTSVNQSLQVGDSPCDLGLGVFFFGSDSDKVGVTLGIDIAALDNSDGYPHTFKDKSDITNAFATDEYKTAVQIIQSFKQN